MSHPRSQWRIKAAQSPAKQPGTVTCMHLIPSSQQLHKLQRTTSINPFHKLENKSSQRLREFSPSCKVTKLMSQTSHFWVSSEEGLEGRKGFHVVEEKKKQFLRSRSLMMVRRAICYIYFCYLNVNYLN